MSTLSDIGPVGGVPRLYPFNSYYGPDRVFLVASYGPHLLGEIIGEPTLSDEDVRRKMVDQFDACPLVFSIASGVDPGSHRAMLCHATIRRLPVDRDWWDKHRNPNWCRN